MGCIARGAGATRRRAAAGPFRGCRRGFGHRPRPVWEGGGRCAARAFINRAAGRGRTRRTRPRPKQRRSGGPPRPGRVQDPECAAPAGLEGLRAPPERGAAPWGSRARAAPPGAGAARAPKGPPEQRISRARRRGVKGSAGRRREPWERRAAAWRCAARGGAAPRRRARLVKSSISGGEGKVSSGAGPARRRAAHRERAGAMGLGWGWRAGGGPVSAGGARATRGPGRAVQRAARD
ncbi:MAG: hypothetical protein J3K34DRAFT_231348 [Monoraphidium minutum]|nr:MAG: hypothetical protein J3K34DRAFT_231348 [Monoraphidium minutum]